jgi:secondary thiamine-phosphate synthase enzyme
MEFYREIIAVTTQGEIDLIDLTRRLNELLKERPIKEGLAHLFVPGSTAALTTIEFESGLIDDFKELLKKLVPKNSHYRHNLAWEDGNAHSHLRASMIGPSLTVPIVDGQLALGVWQQVVLVELDVRPRKRQIILELVGRD